jgi:ribonuclease/clavin/mitogillin
MSERAQVMLGMNMPDTAQWSDRVHVALGQNPSAFTGPGTNTYLVGTGSERILLDTGSGLQAYLPVLEDAMKQAGCDSLQEIVLTHGHPDHIGGIAQVRERFGPLEVKKMPWPGNDENYSNEISEIGDGAVVRTEGATLRALHTPGHARDHLCFLLEEERALFSGDNVLGVGTTVIPSQGGDLLQYMDSLKRALSEAPGRIYPAHGPCIEDGPGKLREYIAHREDRERQILQAMESGAATAGEIVKIVYAAYPTSLHAAAGQSVTSHLLKLERENTVAREANAEALQARWRRV